MNTPRTITSRHRGEPHGFIRRIVSPGDLGEQLKPFVFLDHLYGHVAPGAGFGFHPHSGIATLTYPINADATYEDATGAKGTIRATGLEWMRASGGTWHQGFVQPQADIAEGFQLWLALPPGLEDAEAESHYLAPEDVPQVGPVRVLLGAYGGQRNPIPLPSPITYLDVVLVAGETWSYTPAPEEDVAWAFAYRGRVTTAGQTIAGELVVFERGNAPIAFTADEDARLILGSARRHEHPLVLGSHSVHTNPASLTRGMERIREIGRELQRAGRM